MFRTWPRMSGNWQYSFSKVTELTMLWWIETFFPISRLLYHFCWITLIALIYICTNLKWTIRISWNIDWLLYESCKLLQFCYFQWQIIPWWVNIKNIMSYLCEIIALWGWFSRDMLPVTCCEYGPSSIATVHFSKFSTTTTISFS